MSSTAAAALKQKGNDCFKAGRMTEAAAEYSKAEKVDPSDPVYPSNLSAALYELGDYMGCVEAIARSAVVGQISAQLSEKLECRLVKALRHAVQLGTCSSEELRKYLSLCGVSPEKKVQPAAPLEDRTASRRRLSTLPIFRKPFYAMMEYYTMGQDSIMALTDDLGPDEPYPLDIDKLPEDSLSNISFLFGGVGDARHAYGTLIGAYRRYKALRKPSKKQKFHLHMTFLDIHPGVLARNVLVLIMLDELVSDRKTMSKEHCAELKATIFYTIAGAVIPPYCFDILQAKMRFMKSILTSRPHQYPSWLHVNESSIPHLVFYLDYWMTTQKSTAKVLSIHRGDAFTGSPERVMATLGVSNEFQKDIRSSISQQRAQMNAMLDNTPDSMLSIMGFSGPNARQQMEPMREMIVDMLMAESMTGNSPGRFTSESDWYGFTKVYLPPSELWGRHPEFEKFRLLYKGKTFSAALKSRLSEHVKNTWKPNITLFDPKYHEPHPLHNPQANGYPMFHFSAFQMPQQIEAFLHRQGMGRRESTDASDVTPDAPAYSHISRFIDALVDAIEGLKGHLMVEVLCGDLMQELAKLKYEERPPKFPRTFMRAWLSNVPDYTQGILNTVVYTLPSIQGGPESAAAANCLLNSGIWETDEDFVYNYTLLSLAEVPRYLGCRLDSCGVRHKSIVLGNKPLPRPLDELASRNELLTWLHRLFVNTLIPGVSPQHGAMAQGRLMSVRMPNNLAAFAGLLVWLSSVGYPVHWIADFVQSLIADAFVTDAVPYTEVWPIKRAIVERKVSKKRKLRLDPWIPELENIFAIGWEAFPFALTAPLGFPTSHHEVGLYEAPVQSSSYMVWLTLHPYDSVVNLIFWRDGGAGMADATIASLPEILDGRVKKPPSGHFFILTSTELFDIPGCRITWRLSRARYRRIKEEGNWFVAGYRTDVKTTVTHPSPCASWTEAEKGQETEFPDVSATKILELD